MIDISIDLFVGVFEVVVTIEGELLDISFEDVFNKSNLKKDK